VNPERRRRVVALRGVVQGVGFRPWAARTARRLGLAGDVSNTKWGVRVALEGDAQRIDAWLTALHREPPEGVLIEGLEMRDARPTGARGFAIAPSETRGSGARGRIPPDVAVCDACRDELFDPASRRHRYPFTHCARCGPRASVLLALPYDRARTTLAPFLPCAECAHEYIEPSDRRFHAQTVACPSCGPQLSAQRASGEPLVGDPLEAAAACLRQGGIVALQGYGGYHLACDATQREAVARLRKRKARPTRPFAVLVPSLRSARELAHLAREDEEWLAGRTRAVVVAPRRSDGCAAIGLADEVAPRTSDVGLLLPFAPVHWLLLHGPGTSPGAGHARFGALVFTSANRSEEPTVHDPADARARLSGIADLLVDHDRGVARPSDDPVVRSAPGGPIPLRLSRATAPLVLRSSGVSGNAPVVLAVGGDLKAAPAVCAHGEVVLGEHVGDLACPETADALEARASTLAELLGVRPEIVAHDLHPEYVGTQLAARLAERFGAETCAVQHHHAHAVACLVEHEEPGPALALVLDGAGWGADGTIWGGELLRVTRSRATRLGHLEPVPLPGGEAAVREPWRMAFAWLRRAFPDDPVPRLPWHARRDPAALATLGRALERGVASLPTSSCGRLFDAVASLLDAGDVASHEGEAAMALEALAETAKTAAHPLDVTASSDEPGEIRAADLVRSLALALAAGAPRAELARAFHEALAARFAEATTRAARTEELRSVVLSGGCLQNRLLSGLLETHLARAGLRVLRHRRLPPNDGGLAVGQAVAAAAQSTGAGPPRVAR
jgi:hydrogenase maturation protein HypF